MKGGLAGLTCFGDFTGGDLVLKELGVRMIFPPGSTCLLRGTENHHFIMPHQGSRSALGFGKEDVRNDYLWFTEKILTTRHNAVTNMTRKFSTLSTLEQEARNMYGWDWTDQQIVDLLWKKVKWGEHDLHSPDGGKYTRKVSVELSDIVV